MFISLLDTREFLDFHLENGKCVFLTTGFFLIEGRGIDTSKATNVSFHWQYNNLHTASLAGFFFAMVIAVLCLEPAPSSISASFCYFL